MHVKGIGEGTRHKDILTTMHFWKCMVNESSRSLMSTHTFSGASHDGGGQLRRIEEWVETANYKCGVCMYDNELCG